MTSSATRNREATELPQTPSTTPLKRRSVGGPPTFRVTRARRSLRGQLEAARAAVCGAATESCKGTDRRARDREHARDHDDPPAQNTRSWCRGWVLWCRCRVCARRSRSGGGARARRHVLAELVADVLEHPSKRNTALLVETAADGRE